VKKLETLKVDMEIAGKVKTLTEEELNTKTCILLKELEKLLEE
jgi:hypothetical protein